MEVHKHPHHVTHKKKWEEYLLEFFMLFLAVFLGFVAENIREHNVEKNREKEDMHTMVQNLKYDTTRAASTFRNNKELENHLDSFRAEISKAMKGIINPNKLYYDYLLLGRTIYYAAINTSAVTQMQSAGTLRLIKNDALTNEMMDYYNRKFRVTERFFGEAHETLLDLLKASKDYFNSEYFVNTPERTGNNSQDSAASLRYFQTFLSMKPTPELLKTQRGDLIKLYNDVAAFEEDVTRYNYALRYLMQLSAGQLIKHIQEEYHFSNG